MKMHEFFRTARWAALVVLAALFVATPALAIQPQVTIVQKATSGVNGVGTSTVTFASVPLPGDFLIVENNASNFSSISGSGWSVAGSDMLVFVDTLITRYKFAGASEPKSITITNNGQGLMTAYELANVNPTTPLDCVITTTTLVSGTCTPTGLGELALVQYDVEYTSSQGGLQFPFITGYQLDNHTTSTNDSSSFAATTCPPGTNHCEDNTTFSLIGPVGLVSFAPTLQNIVTGSNIGGRLITIQAKAAPPLPVGQGQAGGNVNSAGLEIDQNGLLMTNCFTGCNTQQGTPGFVKIEDANNSGNVAAVNGAGQVATIATSPIVAGANTIGNVGLLNVPTGATSVTSSATAAAAAICTATLPGVAAKTTFLSGFTISTGNPAAAVTSLVAITGTISGALNYQLVQSLTLGSQLNVQFNIPVPASAVNTAIVVTLPATAGGSVSACTATGYQF